MDPAYVGNLLVAALLAIPVLAAWLGNRAKADRRELRMRRGREVAWEDWRFAVKRWAAQHGLTVSDGDRPPLPAGDPPPEDDE